ncbi:XopAG/AvrGf1 family type III secretion system effector [Mesorhizobium sp. M1A.F.Ca.IN.022.05.2.1]|uniref:XopAG/AvrGf1 family type III secretion system effector n=1 Tax=Mesorhizobium sp. M1A.F.Ca.IN.022.05.2.1 TaxID=2496760 RepID=UPI0019D113E7|nr:XopAG/AvrGf1 family type III secretion system effector [Mesorhizobium sp. M1A.F.Ca.IN.022.05.2.1]
MRIWNSRLDGFSTLNRLLVDGLTESPGATNLHPAAAHSPVVFQPRSTQTPPARKPERPKSGDGAHGGGATGDGSNLFARALKYSLCLVGAGCAYDKIANDFPLSTTSLHDGRQGFTSNERLRIAQAKASKYYTRYHAANPEAQRLNGRPLIPIRACGNNQFVTMIDYRAATSVHLARLVESSHQARRSLVLNLACMKGLLVKAECLAKYRPPQVPKDPDLTKSPLYDKKNKYALTGVLNDDTGAYGYTSRSATQPFVNKGAQHFQDALESDKGLTFKQCVETLEALLDKTGMLGEQAQVAAGQTILNFRQVYTAEAHWGSAEKVVMKTLAEHGLLSLAETEKLDASLMFEDPHKNKLKRNSSLVGPWLHKLDTRLQEMRSAYDPAVVEDLNHSYIAGMKNLPIAHFKLNERGNGFEDCSGFGDSFTCANAVACINHARLMSGQQRLSKEEVIVVISCLNAVYDDTSSIRHTLHEIARGCFAGAGSSIEDADAFYLDVCQKAAQEYYGGKNLSKFGLMKV